LFTYWTVFRLGVCGMSHWQIEVEVLPIKINKYIKGIII